MRIELRTHRTALMVILAAALILSLAGLAAGDRELVILPWALPVAVLIGLWWEARETNSLQISEHAQ